MKKILLLSFILVMLTAIVVAQVPHQHIDQKMQENATVDTGYFFMENGRVLHIMDATRMGSKIQNDIVLKNGTIIKPDGSYKLQSGSQLQLKNGEIMDMDGIQYKSERKFFKKTNRTKLEKVKVQRNSSNGHQQHNNGSSSGHQH